MSIDVNFIIEQILSFEFQFNNINSLNHIRIVELADVEKELQISDGRHFYNEIIKYLDKINLKESEYYIRFERNIPLTDSMNPHIKRYCKGNF